MVSVLTAGFAIPESFFGIDVKVILLIAEGTGSYHLVSLVLEFNTVEVEELSVVWLFRHVIP